MSLSSPTCAEWLAVLDVELANYRATGSPEALATMRKAVNRLTLLDDPEREHTPNVTYINGELFPEYKAQLAANRNTRAGR